MSAPQAAASPTGAADAASPSLSAGAPFAASPSGDDGLLPPSSSGPGGGDGGLGGLSTQLYLERTVMGVLVLALEDVCRVRPPNPVDYLGSYLLRRSSANNTVEVTYDDTVPKAVATDND